MKTTLLRFMQSPNILVCASLNVEANDIMTVDVNDFENGSERIFNESCFLTWKDTLEFQNNTATFCQ